MTAVVSLPPSVPWAGVLEQGASPGQLDCPAARREGVLKAGGRQGLGEFRSPREEGGDFAGNEQGRHYTAWSRQLDLGLNTDGQMEGAQCQQGAQRADKEEVALGWTLGSCGVLTGSSFGWSSSVAPEGLCKREVLDSTLEVG